MSASDLAAAMERIRAGLAGVPLICLVVFLCTVLVSMVTIEILEDRSQRRWMLLCEKVGGTVTWAEGEFSCAPLHRR